MILCTDFDAILAIKKKNCCIGHIKCSNCASYKVIRTRTVYHIQLFIVPFYMEYGRENGVAILLFNREIITNCIFCGNCSATFYNTTLEKHCFHESGFPRARTSQ